MNRYRCAGLPATSTTRRLAVLSPRNLKITLIILYICSASCLVYQALTAIRKDCGRIGKKASAHNGRAQTPAFSRTRRRDRPREKRQRRTAMALKVELKP